MSVMRALVTGGNGFLGRYIVEALLADGHAVTSVSRRAAPELEALGATAVRCDLADPPAVEAAVRGHDTVFHVAAKTGVWGPYDDYHRANVLGTEHVLAACRAAGVARLVYTGSPSATFDGRDHVHASNDVPYPERFLCAYPETKAIAERAVLAANGPELATCALRPHLIIGPRDPHLLPRLIARGRAGKLAIVGAGDNEVSLTWVENAARAHVQAALALTPTAAHAGRAYFVNQADPVRLWDWVAEVFRALDVPPIGRRLPLPVAFAIGAGMEGFWKLTGRAGEPPMTRFVALQLARSHSFDLAPIERDFGYTEEVTTAAATERLIRHLSSTRGAS